MQPKIVFFGTPLIGATVLEKLITKGFKPQAVVTRPNKPAGRKQILTPPPVKVLAEKHQIKVLQPPKLKDNPEFAKELAKLEPDLAIVAAYGQIIPKEILQIPKFGFLNVHPSLLPKYRGASPIQAAILDGAKITGVTIMVMDEELDHGPILAQQSLPIKDDDTTSTLSVKLATLGGELLGEILPVYLTWKKQIAESQQKTVYSLFLPPKEQNHQLATFTKMLKKEDGFIDLNNPPSLQELKQMIRAFHPWPGIYTKVPLKGQKLKIIKFLPGDPFLIQPEGGKPLTINEFLNGYPEAKNCLQNLLPANL